MVICAREMSRLPQTFTNREKWIRFDFRGVDMLFLYGASKQHLLQRAQ